MGTFGIAAEETFLCQYRAVKPCDAHLSFYAIHLYFTLSLPLVKS